MHTAEGALKLFGSWPEVPVKSMVASRMSFLIFIDTLIRAPLSSG
jgi:hypothetical protein